MLPTLFSPLTESDFTLEFASDASFFDETTPLDLIVLISPGLETDLLTSLTDLETATGTLTITNGLIEGTFETDTGEIIADSLDLPDLLTDLNALLLDSAGTLSLANGFLNATLISGDEQFDIANFNLASFAAEGISFLLSEVETTTVLQDGALAIDTETLLGPVFGVIDFGNGFLDIDLDTPLGVLDFERDFGPEDQYSFSLPTSLGTFDANFNLDSGLIEVDLFLGMELDIPISSLTGSFVLDDGVAALTVDTPLGGVTTDFEFADLIGDQVFDFLTGLTVDADLLAGQLNLAATDGQELVETTVDLLGLNAEAIATVSQTNGDFALVEGALNGVASVGEEAIAISGSVDDLIGLLTMPLSGFFASPEVMVGEG